MVDSDLFEIFNGSHVDKQLEIEYSDGIITNKELFSESMELTESLCSESELRFGSCEAGCIKFRIANIFIPMFGKEIKVRVFLDGNRHMPFAIGTYRVYSDTPTADRRWRDIIAYDVMYDILSAEVSGWYNAILPNEDSAIKMRQFRKSFLEYFGVKEDDPDAQLANDDMMVQKTVQPEEMSGKDVVTSICEINGCFGHITREGKFRYVYLEQGIQGLYPRNDLYPADDLYPRTPKTSKMGANGTYISCKYEDFQTRTINKLQIRKEENDIGVIINESGENAYIIENNFLVYGKGEEELRRIGNNLFEKITDIVYRPFSAEIQGNPCFEVGDAVRMVTRYEMIETYILERTLKGIQGLRDVLSSSGTEVYSTNVNSTHKSIIELRGKSNVLTRTIEETKSELKDTERNLRSTIAQTAGEIRSEVENTADGLSSRITQNADKITAEVKRATAEEGELSSKITQTATEIRSEVKNTTDGLSSRIIQNADSITAEVKRASDAEGNLSSRIIQNADSIMSEVKRANAAEGNLSSRITQNANEIDVRVRKDGVVSSINLTPETITIDARRIDLKGLVNAEELVSKFATITTLNATTADLQNLISQKASISSLNATNAEIENLKVSKLSASEFTAENISAMNISVQSANVIGGFSAGKITSGTISADRLDVEGIIKSNTFRGAAITVQALYALSGITVNGTAMSKKTATFLTASGKTEKINYLGF